MRRIAGFCLAMNHDILGGEQWPEKSLKIGKKKKTRVAILSLTIFEGGPLFMVYIEI